VAALQKAGQSFAEFLSLQAPGQWGDVPEEDLATPKFTVNSGG
jgi:hypothetical protein